MRIGGFMMELSSAAYNPNDSIDPRSDTDGHGGDIRPTVAVGCERES